jgi:hypothetical protein
LAIEMNPPGMLMGQSFSPTAAHSGPQTTAASESRDRRSHY